MTKTISAADATARLPELLGWVEHGDDVILERHGEPAFVILPAGAYAELLNLRDLQRRVADVAELRAIRARVRAQNHDLTNAEAVDWADRFVAEAFEGIATSGTRRRPSSDPDSIEGSGADGTA